MAYKKLNMAVGAALAMAAMGALAQAIPIRPAYAYPLDSTSAQAGGPQSVQLGESPFYLAPYVGLAAGYDDNVVLTNVNEKSSALYILSPGLLLEARDSSKVFRSSYQGQYARYPQSDDDDYLDHFFRNSLDMALAERLYGRLGYDYIRSHDPRGSTDRAVQTNPDKYRLNSVNATLAYGTPGSDGRAEAYYGYGSKVYLNNRSVTVASDRDTQEFGGAFYLRVMPSTYAVLDLRRTDQSYKQPGSLLSSEENRILAGVTWEASAATSGTIKVGRLEKKFDSDLPKFSGTAWEALVSWAPRTYSRFDLYTARYPTESTGQGTFILSDAAGVNWKHSWTAVLSTDLALRYQKDEYQSNPRSDDTKSFAARVGYRFRPWMTLGAEWTWTQRDSNQNNNDYDKNLLLLTATVSM
jgi:polysaccharide biosynthesis protein VpsM